MPDKRLIDYITKEELEGYTPKQLRDHLVKQGWKPLDVDEALKAVEMSKKAKKLKPAPKPNTVVKPKPAVKSITKPMTKEIKAQGYTKSVIPKSKSSVNPVKPKPIAKTVAKPVAKQTNVLPKPKPAAKPVIVQGGIKKRNPWIVLLLSIITFGIYTIYWLVSTTLELKNSTKSAPNPKLLWLLLIPFVNIIILIMYYWKYSSAINELTGFSKAGLFVLWIFLSPVAIVLSQMELNKKVM